MDYTVLFTVRWRPLVYFRIYFGLTAIVIFIFVWSRCKRRFGFFLLWQIDYKCQKYARDLFAKKLRSERKKFYVFVFNKLRKNLALCTKLLHEDLEKSSELVAF